MIDTRSAEAYQKSHLPGALNIPEIFTFLVTPEGRRIGKVLQKFFKQKLELNGIRPDDSVIIYEDAMDNGYGQSCRGRFLLNYFGHKDVRVFSWRIPGLGVKRTPIKQLICRRSFPHNMKMKINSEEMLTSQDILEAINGPPPFIFWIAGTMPEWVGATSSPYGVDYSPRKGRIPGAHWIEWYEMMLRKDGIPWMKEEDEILKICERNGITADTKVYIYCFKGARASQHAPGSEDVRHSECKKTISGPGMNGLWIFSLPIDESYPEF